MVALASARCGEQDVNRRAVVFTPFATRNPRARQIATFDGVSSIKRERMRSAFAIEMGATTKQMHEASIRAALNTVGGITHGTVAPRWRLRVPALIVASLIVLPLGTAIASEDAVPGDLLYAIKRLVDPLRSVLDSDIAAEHRVDELAHLIDRAAHRGTSATLSSDEVNPRYGSTDTIADRNTEDERSGPTRDADTPTDTREHRPLSWLVTLYLTSRQDPANLRVRVEVRASHHMAGQT